MGSRKISESASNSSSSSSDSDAEKQSHENRKKSKSSKRDCSEERATKTKKPKHDNPESDSEKLVRKKSSSDDNSNRHNQRSSRDDRDTRDRGDRSREDNRSKRDYNKRYDDRGRRNDYNYNRRENNSQDYSRSRERYHKDDRDNRNRRDNRNNDRRRRRSPSFDHANAKWGKPENSKTNDTKPSEKQKPNFSLSGKLTEETNSYRGVVIKYSEPPEARKPRRRWRLYPFKGEKALQTLYIHRESAYLIGRDRKIVDLPVDHPSCSKQHAALQYRLVPFTRDDGSSGKRVRPYIIDLESANGTFINNKKIDPKKYVELLEKDVVKFGFSSREYVLLHENSKDEALDDDVKQEDVEVPVKEEVVE